MKLMALLFAVFAVGSTAQAQYTSSTNCYAYTTCYDNYGYAIGTASCQTYGYQYVQSYGFSANNSCSWYVIPGVSVQCAGYVQSYDAYTGQYIWGWQNYSVRCPGR